MMTDTATDMATLLGAEGLFARVVPGFAPRLAQQHMAHAVQQAIADGQNLVVEAGTGTGKTYAYLVPALLGGGRVIVSTGTKALQDQLYQRDLPRVQEVLGVHRHIEQLKGRANYLCRHRFEQIVDEGSSFATRYASELAKIKDWSIRTRRGDLMELTNVPEDSPLRPSLTSTTENCLGEKCAFYDDCFVMKAREKALNADLLVVNHHLLLADWALKQDGFGKLLPDVDAFILDEAHKLPELAGQFFAQSIRKRQLQELGKDTTKACNGVEAAFAVLQDPLAALQQAVDALHGALVSLPAPRASLQQLEENEEACADPKGALEIEEQERATLEHKLGFNEQERDDLQERASLLYSKGIDLDWYLKENEQERINLEEALDKNKKACAQPQDRLKDSQGTRAALEHLGACLTGLAEHLASQAERSPELKNVHQRAEQFQEILTHILKADGDQEVYWYECSQSGFALHATPLNLAAPLHAMRAHHPSAWIYTSATLSVAGDFAHFTRQIGLDNPQTLSLDSPFDYTRQALCYRPVGLPEPHEWHYAQAMLDAVVPVLQASRGRAFLLFTSHTALKYVAQQLPKRGSWPLFVQGQMPRHQLLEDFRQSGNGILLGAASFWEGVDVAGEALSLVVIDKLPFAAPDDPVLEARLDAMKKRGDNPFIHWQLPSAVIALKQGAGRLIRDVQDRGVLMLCDPRLSTKNYGQKFLRSLPLMRHTRKLEDVAAFFAASDA